MYSSTMVLPANYARVEEDEMMYLTGGFQLSENFLALFGSRDVDGNYKIDALDIVLDVASVALAVVMLVPGVISAAFQSIF